MAGKRTGDGEEGEEADRGRRTPARIRCRRRRLLAGKGEARADVEVAAADLAARGGESAAGRGRGQASLCSTGGDEDTAPAGRRRGGPRGGALAVCRRRGEGERERERERGAEEAEGDEVERVVGIGRRRTGRRISTP
ncbi:hypothetical protein U9M48_020825 [Paspalum notatum var. saurae]|uniref:Uncharacterized protein n=1 Tax=Paspalum notatum var. saurae TaxID=547442 RepID=A0AAQ3TH25_PASNO